MEIIRFYLGLYANLDDMGCTWNARARDWHDFLNIARQTVDVRKVRKMVIKSKLCKTRPIKRI